MKPLHIEGCILAGGAGGLDIYYDEHCRGWFCRVGRRISVTYATGKALMDAINADKVDWLVSL